MLSYLARLTRADPDAAMLTAAVGVLAVVLVAALVHALLWKDPKEWFGSDGDTAGSSKSRRARRARKPAAAKPATPGTAAKPPRDDRRPTGSGTETPADAPSIVVAPCPSDSRTAEAKADAKADDKNMKDIELSANDLTMVFAKRLAGAVYRLEWKRGSRTHVVVPELEGNGGSLQTALAFDIPIGESSEVNNPTEAGNHADRYGKTSSRWLGASATKNSVTTRSRLAYYYAEGEKVPSSPKGSVGQGQGMLSDVTLTKTVTIGWKRFPNVVQYDIRLDWKRAHHFAQIQILAVYLARDFQTVYLVKRGKAERHAGRAQKAGPSDMVGISPPDTSYPIILAKTNDVAVGLYAHTVPPNGRFKPTWQPWYTCSKTAGHKDFGKGLQQVDLSAMSAVWHAGSQTDTAVRIDRTACFGCALVFGSVAEVAATIGKLSDMLRPLAPAAY